jgi:hypothetical protein
MDKNHPPGYFGNSYMKRHSIRIFYVGEDIFILFAPRQVLTSEYQLCRSNIEREGGTHTDCCDSMKVGKNISLLIQLKPSLVEKWVEFVSILLYALTRPLGRPRRGS